MITTKIVTQTIVGNNINHYKNLGYKVKQHQKIEIPIEHLPQNSRCKINAECDICCKQLLMNYAVYNKYFKKQNKYTCKNCSYSKNIETNKIRYGVENSSQDEKVKLKLKNTNIHKYGVDNVLSVPRFLQKMKDTNLAKYGKEHVSQLSSIQDKCKSTRIRNGFQLPDEEKSDWKIYNDKVDKVTRKFKKQLIFNWDGYDYYDEEYIKNNFQLHHTNKAYPTIDHKISIFEGFCKRISPIIIGDILNLCLTKRSLNAKKSIKNSDEFKKLIN